MTENKRAGNDYVSDECGGVVVLGGAQALLQRALFLLQVRRGSFPFLPELGSQMYLLGREKPSARQAVALAYAKQALQPLPLTVEAATVTEAASEGLAVRLDLRTEDGTAELEVTV